MKHLSPPADEYGQPLVAGDVFEACVSMVKDPTLRAKLRVIRQEVEAEAADYDIKAANKRLYQKKKHSRIGNVSREELVKVYTRRMVPKKSNGRPIYNRIIAAPVHGRCPLCGIGTVNTLDHYLPKKHFPVFSVTPNNLVPACTWCQREKGEYYANSEDQQLLHPYFDDMNDNIWLKAEVVKGAPVVFRFFASPPANWPRSAKARVATHLEKLNLPALFSSNAGSRLSEIRARLTDLYQKKGGGKPAVRAHLREELASIEADNKNSWVAAMYRAAIANHWFCEGGFLNQ